MTLGDGEIWDTSASTMDRLRARIVPVRHPDALRNVLAQDFSRDCTELPISGGWGYSQDEAIRFERDKFPIPQAADYVGFEYHIVQKLLYEELIIFQPKGAAFSGIDHRRKSQQLLGLDGRYYDKLVFEIDCWSDYHWELLKQDWEENDYGQRPGFDLPKHTAKRDAARISYEREFWFDVTEVFGSTI